MPIIVNVIDSVKCRYKPEYGASKLKTNHIFLDFLTWNFPNVVRDRYCSHNCYDVHKRDNRN